MLTAITKTVSTFRTRQLLTLAAAVMLPFAGAFAQSSLPDELIRKNEITPADRQTIKLLIDANKAGLSGGPVEIKKAREVLVAPLEKDGVSVPFRVAYANALLESGLEKLATSDNDLIAANALRIAGQGATGSTLKIVIDGLADKRPQVRLAAAVAARAAFAAARNNPALNADELAKAMKALGDAVTTDGSPAVIDGALQALIAARDIPGNRSAAVERLTDAAGKRALALAKANQPIDLTPLLRVAGPVRQDITEAEKLSPEARKSVAAFAGQLLIAVNAAWKDGDPDPATVQTAKAANAILSLAAESITGAKVTITIDELVAPGKREQFQRALPAIIGPGGMLVSPPFSVPADKLKP